MTCLFLILLYVVMIFHNIISRYIPGGNYLDELLCIAFVTLAIIQWMLWKGHRNKNRYVGKMITGSLLVFSLGMLSTFQNSYITQIDVIFKDILLTFKFFLTYISANYLLGGYKSKKLWKYLVNVSKAIVVCLFAFGCISLVVNIGMGADIRYGLRSYQFLYSHYTYLVFNTVILLAVIETDNKKNMKYAVMGILVLLFTLRTKAFMFAALYILIKVVIYSKNKQWNIKKYFKIRYIFPLLILLFFVAYPQLKQYLEWGYSYNLRNGLYIIGLFIAKDHFPLGTGFGTFATNISLEVDSPIYNIYHMETYQGIGSFDGAMVSDVFWPSIYAQFGFIACGIYIYILFMQMKNLVVNPKKISAQSILGQMLIMSYLLISSIAEASFTNDTAVFAAVVIVMIGSFKSEKQSSHESGLEKQNG